MVRSAWGRTSLSHPSPIIERVRPAEGGSGVGDAGVQLVSEANEEPTNLSKVELSMLHSVGLFDDIHRTADDIITALELAIAEKKARQRRAG